MANKIDIPNGWEVKKLGEIGNFLKGKGIKKDELCDNGLPCVIYGQIYTSYDFYTDKFTSFIPINLKPYTTEIYQNDILFAGSGETKEEIGKSIAYIGKECAYAGGDIIILRQDKVISIFITYYLNSIGRKHLNRLGQGDSVVHIYKSILESVKIPVPPLAEQEKIAEILSLWDKAIEQTKELITYKEKQKKGLMQNLLTGKKRLHGFNDKWKTVKLGDCFTFIKGQGLSKEKINSSGKYFCILYGELYTTYTEVIQQVVSKTNHAEGILSKSGDILIPCSTTTKAIDLATASSIKIDDVYIGADINILRPKININSDFIAFSISNIIKNTIAKYAQGSTIIHLYGKDIKPIKIKLPTIYEQNNIVDILCKADEEIELLNKQLDLYTEQKKGLMQNLLTGKVRVTV